MVADVKPFKTSVAFVGSSVAVNIVVSEDEVAFGWTFWYQVNWPGVAEFQSWCWTNWSREPPGTPGPESVCVKSIEPGYQSWPLPKPEKLIWTGSPRVI